MNDRVLISPPNSLVLVMDPDSGVVPDSMEGKLVSNTESCIAVGTRATVDGETEVVFRNSALPRAGLMRAFQGTVATPNQTLSICTIYGDVLLKKKVNVSKSAIEIWVDDETEPSTIEVHTEATE